MVLAAIVRVPELDTPPPLLPEMMLFSMLTVPRLDKPPNEVPPIRVALRSVRSPGVGGVAGGEELFFAKMRPKAGASPWRAIVAPLPSIVIRLVIEGRPIGSP